MRFPIFGGLGRSAAGRAARRLRRGDAGLDEHSAGARLHAHRRNAGRHRPLHGSAAARRLRGLRLVAPSRRGGDSATAAIFASSLSRMAEPASAHYMALVGMVALLTAGLLVLARILGLVFFPTSCRARRWSDFSPASAFRSGRRCSANGRGDRRVAANARAALAGR